MMTFGYKNKFNGPLRALTALAIGIVMIVSKANALTIVVRVIAAFLVASGLVSFFIGYRNRENGAMGLMGFNAVVDIVLGLIVFMWPGFIAGLIVYFIAVVLILFGLYQLLSLGSANRVVKVGAVAFLLPALVLILGVFLLMKPLFIGEAMGTLAGVALIVYGVSELLSSWKMSNAIKEYEIQHPEPETPRDNEEVIEVKDVDFEKVDEQ